MKGEREKKEEKEEGKGGRKEQGRKRGRENVERPGIEGMKRSESFLNKCILLLLENPWFQSL